MTTLNATAANKTASKAEPDKVSEKIAEKRRALGRGLESLLPGPRAVAAVPSLPQTARNDAAPAVSSALPAAAHAVPPQASDGLQPDALPAVVEELQAVSSTPEGERTILLNLDQIERNPYQTRTEFDPSALGDLAGSIQAQGVLQPIVVRPTTRHGLTLQGEAVPFHDRYILILGERRFRASRLAGKTTIPAIVKRVSEQQAAEMTLVENLQRQDLDCLDQAAAFANLSTQFRLTQDEIGQRVGVSREQVSNYLRLLKLPPEVQVALRKKELTYSHARLLLALDDDDQITKVARVVIAKKMSVALLQELVLDSKMPQDPPDAKKAGGARWVDPNVRSEQRSLEAILGVRVRIRDRKGRGKILIEYGTLEEFDRVVRMLKGK
ncbi:MAG: ParB/RepB/Spo0J family partition protein [Terriglobales bacterium]